MIVPARARLIAAVVAGPALASGGCHRSSTDAAPAAAAAQTASTAARPASPPAAANTESAPRRDLSVDESMGGHTLARHVGRTDDQLRDRLKREPQISAASTYTDRTAAERAVGASLAAGGAALTAWERRNGRRPNLVLHYRDPAGAALGRSLARGQRTVVACDRALVVLRWNDRAERFYVLTSYPEATR